MAKRKLTSEQRDSVRKEVKEMVAGGKPRAEVLKAVAEKYGISTESARWYLKDGKRDKKAKSGKKPKANAPRKAVAGGKKASSSRQKKVGKTRRPPAARRSGSRGRALLQVVAKLSEDDLRKALGVKRLWTERVHLLERKQEIERDLHQVTAKVRQIDRRIGRIAGA